MFENPFSPIFGGRPGMFFGRQEVIAKFQTAMNVNGSHYRTLFITGGRGSGKTTLLERLSSLAEKEGYLVVDAVYSNAVDKLFKETGGYQEITSTVEPEVGFQAFGVGANVKAGSQKRTNRYGKADLGGLIQSACEKSEKGLLLTIDEVQKIHHTNLEAICNAFQLASRKGADVLLVVAGLPGSYEKVTRYKGCTYMRRAVHEEIGLFDPDSTHRAFASSVESIDQLDIEPKALDRAVGYSKGQPYLMQLMGFHLIEYLNRSVRTLRHDIGREEYMVNAKDIDAAFQLALPDYRQGALKPIVNELPDLERRYLMAAAESLNDDRVSLTSDIKLKLGETDSSKLSTPRSRLISRELIVSAGYGKVAFAVPYLADYLLQEEEASKLEETILAWKL